MKWHNYMMVLSYAIAVNQISIIFWCDIMIIADLNIIDLRMNNVSKYWYHSFKIH